MISRGRREEPADKVKGTDWGFDVGDLFIPRAVLIYAAKGTDFWSPKDKYHQQQWKQTEMRNRATTFGAKKMRSSADARRKSAGN
ncbi:hypothetical protein CDL15_Pgr027694 [Punica granatum]|uniref:Uncharacterized protein n=1 Tax=Punica granatum TaxID=22663 RepID=A0A218XIY9_PUNGR|nr:hypothetical protein CDL15_Pgr027694 [Punica granatum]